jgi:hypothetical protein
MELDIPKTGPNRQLILLCITTKDSWRGGAVMHPAKYTVITNYLKLELRYMDAGERGSRAPIGPRGTPGHQ